MTRWLSSTWVAVAVLCTALVGGSAHAEGTKPLGEKMGERISRGIVEESLESLDKQENRERLGRIVGSPQMQAAMHDLTAAIVLGVVDGVRKSGVTNQKLDMARSMSEGLNKHITPAMGKLTHRLVDSAMTAALADKHIGQVEKLGERTTHAVLAGVASGLRDEVGPALAATLDKDIGPAVARMLERDILPAVGRGLDTPEMQSAVANLTHSVATQLVSGTSDAMAAEQAENQRNGKESGLQVLGGNIAIGYAVAVFVAFALGTALVVLTVVLVRSTRRQRKQAEESKRREDMLMQLLDGLEADHPELRTDKHRLVREQLHTEE